VTVTSEFTREFLNLLSTLFHPYSNLDMFSRKSLVSYLHKNIVSLRRFCDGSKYLLSVRSQQHPSRCREYRARFALVSAERLNSHNRNILNKLWDFYNIAKDKTPGSEKP
jgi:hypothetical protein